MTKTRDMIEIDEELCDGCGLCIPSCHEGAIQVINGKARLVSDSLCDGLGACLGHCPRGALKVSHREAAPFVAPAPDATIPPAAGCEQLPRAAEPSQLSHWPVQIRLVAPHAPFLDDARLVVAADCVPVALPGFHREFVAGSAVMIGCPKFDDLEAYAQRFTEIFATARVRSVTVVVMEVPCCRSLPLAVRRGIEAAGAAVPLEVVVVGIDGTIRERTILPTEAVRDH
jgi:NAD-dependent dihydropyrimidine dehydrogenase PreA subunit